MLAVTDKKDVEETTEKQRNIESDNKELQQTERESLAWIWMLSGLESRGYLRRCYKFACSRSQRPEPGGRDTCSHGENLQSDCREIFTAFINLVRQLTEK